MADEAEGGTSSDQEWLKARSRVRRERWSDGGVTECVDDMLHVDESLSEQDPHLETKSHVTNIGGNLRQATTTASLYTHTCLQHTRLPLYENRIAPVVGSVIVNSGTCDTTSPNSAILREQSCHISVMWGKEMTPSHYSSVNGNKH